MFSSPVPGAAHPSVSGSPTPDRTNPVVAQSFLGELGAFGASRQVFGVARMRAGVLRGCGRFGDEGEVDVLGLATTHDVEGHRVADRMLAYLGDQ